MNDRTIVVKAPLGATIVLRDTSNQDLQMLAPGELVTTVDDQVLRKCGFVPRSEAGSVEEDNRGLPDLKWETTGGIHIFPESTVAKITFGRRMVCYIAIVPPGTRSKTFGLKARIKPAQHSGRGQDLDFGRAATIDEGKRKWVEELQSIRDCLCGGE